MLAPAPSPLLLELFPIGIGVSAMLVAWVLSRGVAAVPTENRQYKDAPPLAFRLLWWPIHWIAHSLARRLSPKSLDAISLRLRQAGLDYSISPQQFVASRVVGAAALAVSGIGVAVSLGSGAEAGVVLQSGAAGALCGWIYPAIWLRDRITVRRRALLKVLPFFLDLVTLCVEAGLNLQGAIHQAVTKGPETPLRDELQRVLRDIRAGKPRAESLRKMATRLNEPVVTSFVAAVIQAENMGMNLAPVLRAQADQRRIERFQRAEKQAMEAPVKMLLPLIAFIFPCTFIVLLFPIAMQLMEAGF